MRQCYNVIMSEGIRREIICGGFCSFYKPGKNEDLKCGTYAFLARNLSTGEIRHAALKSSPRPDYSRDREIRALICDRCEFLVAGCDFREGFPSSPCGGYAIVEGLLKRGRIS